jgi:hypothetical protein
MWGASGDWLAGCRLSEINETFGAASSAVITNGHASYAITAGAGGIYPIAGLTVSGTSRQFFAFRFTAGVRRRQAAGPVRRHSHHDHTG